MNKNRLSFVVPVYKPRLDVLAKCVKALRDQSLKSWEAVFVLDGPNPSAADVIKQGMAGHKHYQILTIEHGGACKARNAGMAKATGEFVVCWDSDCLVEPDTAETWLMMFDKHPDVAFVYSGYRFFDARGAVESEPFDPWLLRVRNYISTCFPVRRAMAGVWDESLKSLQDWDYWLQVVEKGGKGKFLKGYAFATAAPTEDSISGRGCTPEAWLERVDAVKAKHNLPERDVCVSSITKKQEGIWLAKLIDADYQDLPHAKPHKYKTIVQVGFSFVPGMVEAHCANIEAGLKNIVFFTCDDVTEVVTRLNLHALWKYSTLLNGSCFKQYVEDKASYDLMQKAGFNVEVMPLPLAYGDAPVLPEAKRFAMDVSPMYLDIMNVVARSLPDVEIVAMENAHKLSEFTGLIHMHPDRTVGIGMKRAILAGRHVVSNVKAPFMGFVEDDKTADAFIPEMVNKIRELAYSPPPDSARAFYVKQSEPKKLMEALNG